MELIYNVNRQNGKRRELPKEDDILCKLSVKNIIAFTSGCCLNPNKDSESHDSGSYSVYVCDIDKPWEVHLVSSFLHKVVCLEWHNSGFKLLLVTEDGTISIYQMKDYILNEWKLTHKKETDGEHFCAIQWLSHGFMVTLNGDKRDIASYSDKLIRENLPPSLSYFGGKAAEGWIGVTSTGLVCVGLPSNKGDSCVVKTECIEYTRQRLIIADIYFEKTGDIIIMTSSGQISSPIHTHQVSLQLQKEECVVGLSHMNSFYMRRESKGDTQQITMLKMVKREGALSVVICTGSAGSSQVELWSLSKQPLTLKRAFQTTSHDTKLLYNWSHQNTVTHPSLPVSLASANFPLRYHSQHDPSSRMFQYLAVAYRDGSIKIINKHTFQPIATTNLDMGFTDMDKSDKQKKVVPYIVTMQQTLTGCGLVGLDQLGCLYLMKVINTRDTLTHVHPNYMVSVLEYLTFTGADCWDVLISIKPGLLESIIQRLSDEFSKQPVGMQEVLFERHMAVKGSLYSCSAGGQQRAADCHCRLMLHTISTHFKAQLRPKGLSAQDVGPVEKLTSNCNKNTEIDIDKVMMTLNPEKKEFVVQDLTLQASQPLIQWVADLVLYLLTTLPMSQGYGTNFPGYTILRDVSSLATLRELMVVIRIWGLINSRCLPHFTTTTTNLDAMNEMFKILTRVWQVAKENKGMDFDEALIDKCCLLRSQIYPPNNEQGLFGSVSGYSILSQNHPVKLTFQEPPVGGGELAGGEVGLAHRMDMVHQVTLGTNPAQPTKTCSRCGNLCLIESVCKYPVLQAWEGKWLKECPCGGLWKITQAPSNRK